MLRIDRVGDTNAFRVLEEADLRTLIGDPLLRSARVLDELFYPAALVVEADSDARFYHAASRKLSEKLDLYVVNAQNKQTVGRIHSLYKKLGIRSVGLVDFDVLNDDGEFKKQVESLTADVNLQGQLRVLRKEIAEAVEKSPASERADRAMSRLRELLQGLERKSSGSEPGGANSPEDILKALIAGCSAIGDQAKPWAPFKESGRDILKEMLQAKFNELYGITMRLGLIINPYGELESLLTDQGIQYTTNKQLWIQSALLLLPNLRSTRQSDCGSLSERSMRVSLVSETSAERRRL